MYYAFLPKLRGIAQEKLLHSYFEREPEEGTRGRPELQYIVIALHWRLHLPGVWMVYILYIHHDNA